MIETTVTSSPGIDTNTIVESTTDSGVETKRVETQWAKVVTPGFTLTAAAYQIVSRVTIESTWAPFSYVDEHGDTKSMPSTMLTARTTSTETLSGIQTGVITSTPPAYTWVQGGFWHSVTAFLLLTEEITESFTWRENCQIETSTREVKRYYAPLGDPADSAVHLYSDGTYRNDGVLVQFGWHTVESSFTQWNVGAPLTQLSKYVPNGKAAPPNETLDIEDFLLFSVAAGTPPEAAPFPLVGSATVPQVFEEVIMAELDATDASGETKRTESPSLLPYPESVYELLCVAWRRVIRATSDTLDIPHNAIPFLRCGDHVSATNHARSLVNADAYVHAIKRTAEVTNGKMRQVTTAKIPNPDLVAAFKAFRTANGRP